MKRLSSKKSAVRDLLFSAIADYNRSTTNKAMNLFSCLYRSFRTVQLEKSGSDPTLIGLCDQAFKIKDDLKKVIYGVLRCPIELLDLMKQSGDKYKWEHGGLVFLFLFFD